MKKRNTIIILLAVLIVFSTFLTGCVDKDAVKEKLCGSWGYIDAKGYHFYIFSADDTYQSVDGRFNSKGTYKIKNSEIILKDEDGKTHTIIEYTFENNILELVDVSSDRSTEIKLIRAD